jgi:DNA-binding transcriptional LysR family regulator
MQRNPRSRERLPWDDVRLFLALCRAPTVGGAARVLGVDPATVSRRLAALERALGAALFDRRRDGITPTEAAEDLLPVAEEIEGGMMRFASAADRLERTVSGLVRIACPPDVAEVILVPALRELCARHPALRIELNPGESVLDLTRREADVAVRTVHPQRGDLVVTRLMTVRWVLVAAPVVAQALGTLRAWSQAPWLGWGEHLVNTTPGRWLSAHAPAIEPVVRSDSLRLQLALVAAGLGVSLVPELSARHYGLVPVKISRVLAGGANAWPADELFLVTHRALRQVPRIRAVWDLLIDRLADRSPRA